MKLFGCNVVHVIVEGIIFIEFKTNLAKTTILATLTNGLNLTCMGTTCFPCYTATVRA